MIADFKQVCRESGAHQVAEKPTIAAMIGVALECNKHTMVTKQIKQRVFCAN